MRAHWEASFLLPLVPTLFFLSMHRSARRLVNLHSRHTPRRNVIPSFTRIAFARQYASQSEQPVANHQQLLQEKDQRITELQVKYHPFLHTCHQATTYTHVSYTGSLPTMCQGQ